MDGNLDWGPIVEKLGPKLYRYFASRFDEVIADDLTQETLVRLVSKFDQGEFDGQRGSLDMWAFGMARFVRLEAIKKSSKNARHTSLSGEIEDFENAFALYEQSSELIHLRQCIGDLPEPQQEIILLMVDREMGMQDIADHLAIPVGTIKSHIHRAKKTLFSLFTNISGGPDGRQI